MWICNTLFRKDVISSLSFFREDLNSLCMRKIGKCDFSVIKLSIFFSKRTLGGMISEGMTGHYVSFYHWMYRRSQNGYQNWCFIHELPLFKSLCSLQSRRRRFWHPPPLAAVWWRHGALPVSRNDWQLQNSPRTSSQSSAIRKDFAKCSVKAALLWAAWIPRG